MTPRTKVYNAIDTERTHQDLKWGTISQHPQDIAGWMLIMRKELEEAEEAWVNGDPEDCLNEMLQVIATGVAGLEQHGAVTRYDIRDRNESEKQ